MQNQNTNFMDEFNVQWENGGFLNFFRKQLAEPLRTQLEKYFSENEEERKNKINVDTVHLVFEKLIEQEAKVDVDAFKYVVSLCPNLSVTNIGKIFECLAQSQIDKIDIDTFKYIVGLCKNISLTNVCQIFEQEVNNKFDIDENITKLIDNIKELRDLCKDTSIMNSNKLFESLVQHEIELDKDLFLWLKAELKYSKTQHNQQKKGVEEHNLEQKSQVLQNIEEQKSENPREEPEKKELANNSKQIQDEIQDANYNVTQVLDDESILILNLLKTEYKTKDRKTMKCKLNGDCYGYVVECSVNILKKLDDELEKFKNSEQNKQKIIAEKSNIKEYVSDLFKSSMTIVSTVDLFVENPKLIFQLCSVLGIDYEIECLKSVKKMDLGINMSNAKGKLTDWINFLDKIGISLGYMSAFSCVSAYFSKTLSVAKVLESIGVTSNVKTENDFDINLVKMLDVCIKAYAFLTSNLTTDKDKKQHKDFICALIKHFLPEQSDELQKLINDGTEDVIKSVLENLYYGVAELENLVINQEQTKTGQTVRKLFSVEGKNRNRISWFDLIKSVWSKMKQTQAGENFIKVLVKSVLYEMLPYDFKNMSVPLCDILISYLDQTQDERKTEKVKAVIDTCEKIIEGMANEKVSVAELVSDVIKLLDNLSADGIENVDVKPLLDAIFSGILSENQVINTCYQQLFEGKSGIAVIKPILEKIRDGIIGFGDLTIQTIKRKKIKDKNGEDKEDKETKETIEIKLVDKAGKEINWFDLVKLIWKKIDQTDRNSLNALMPPVLFKLFLSPYFQKAKKFIKRNEDKHNAIGIDQNVKDMFNKLKEELNQAVPSRENILSYYKLFVQAIDATQDEDLKLSDEQKEIFEDLKSENVIDVKKFVSDSKDKYTKVGINKDVKDAFVNLQNEFANTVPIRAFVLDKYKLFAQAIKNSKDKNLNLSDEQQKIFENLGDELWQEQIFDSAKRFINSLNVETANFEPVCTSVIKLIDLIMAEDLNQSQVLDAVKAIIENMCTSENNLVSDSSFSAFRGLIGAVLHNGKLLLRLTDGVKELKGLNNQQWFDGVFKNLSVLLLNRLEICSTPNEISNVFGKALDSYQKFAQTIGMPLDVETLKNAITEFEKKLKESQARYNSILTKIMVDEKVKAAYEALKSCVSAIDETKKDFNLKQSLKNISMLYHNFTKAFNDSDIILDESEQKQFDEFKFKFEASQTEIINSVQGMLGITGNMFLDTDPATKTNNLTLKNLIKELIKNGEILKFVTAQSDQLKAIQAIFEQAFPKLSELICLKLDKLENNNDNSDDNYDAGARKESLLSFLENDIHGLLNVYNNFAKALGASSKNNPSYQKDIIISVKNILSYVKDNFVNEQDSIKMYKTLLKEFLGEAIEDRNIKNIFGLRAQQTNILTFIIDKIDLKSDYKQDVGDFKNPLKNSLRQLTKLITDFIDNDIEKNAGTVDNLLNMTNSLLDNYISFASELDKPFDFSKAKEFVSDKSIQSKYYSSKSENVRKAFENLRTELERTVPSRKNVMHRYKLLKNTIGKTKDKDLKLSQEQRNIFESSELNQTNAIVAINKILDSVSDFCQYKKLGEASESEEQIKKLETTEQQEATQQFKDVLISLLSSGKFLSYIIGEIDHIEAASINLELKKYLKGISDPLCNFLICYLKETESDSKTIVENLKFIFNQYDKIMHEIQVDQININNLFDQTKELLVFLDENIGGDNKTVFWRYIELFDSAFKNGTIINLLVKEAKINNPENMWLKFISDDISRVFGAVCRAVIRSYQTSKGIISIIDKSKQIYEIFSKSGETTQAEQSQEKLGFIGKVITGIGNIFGIKVTRSNIEQNEKPEYQIKVVFDYFTFDSNEEPNEINIGSQINEKNGGNQEQVVATDENENGESRVSVADAIVKVLFNNKKPWYLRKIIMPLARKYFIALKNYVNEDRNPDRKILYDLKSKIKGLAWPWGQYLSYCRLRNLLIVRKQGFIRRVANYVSQVIFAPFAILGLSLYMGISFAWTKVKKIFGFEDKKTQKSEIVVEPIVPIEIEQEVISGSERETNGTNIKQINIEGNLDKQSHKEKSDKFEDNVKMSSDTKNKNTMNTKKEPEIISSEKNTGINKNKEKNISPKMESYKANKENVTSNI